MKAVMAVVSKNLYQATGGRAKIGSFNYVNSIKKADVIISLDDAPGRAGYAIRGAIDGKPGQLVLFFRNYETDGPDDFALTAFHEINHYLFALPDEYRDDGAAGNCPLINPSGPGCIMDNYHKGPPRFGWYGRYCGEPQKIGDHNSGAPQAMYADETPDQSCQQLIEKFFSDRPMTRQAMAAPPADEARPNAQDPFTGIFRSLVKATTTLVQHRSRRGREVAPHRGGARWGVVPGGVLIAQAGQRRRDAPAVSDEVR
jgi:hypothetical protein